MKSAERLTPADEAERLSLPTRALLYGAGALAVVAGPVLYLWPRDTAVYFAWEIQNPLTPNFMGANYLAGIGAVWGALSNRWSVARVAMPALIAFAVTQLVATLLHLDILDWSHPTAWAWLVVYVVSPFSAIAAARGQELRWRKATSGTIAAGNRLRLPFLALALVSLAIGLGLFLVPERMASVWPWSLTPLTGRIVGGWLLSAALLHGMLAREPVLERARIGLSSVVVVASLLLVGAALQRHSLDGPASAIAVYLVYLAALGALGIAGLLAVRSDRRTRPATD